jgi:RND family efflux transporter MFP subunit
MTADSAEFKIAGGHRPPLQWRGKTMLRSFFKAARCRACAPRNLLVLMLLVLSIGVALGTSITMFNRSDANAAADPPPASVVEIAAVDGGILQTNAQPVSEPETPDRYVGVLFSRQSADIVARSEGRLEEVYVRLGEQLKAGDLIARIEPASIRRQLEIAQASLRSAQAEERAAEVAVKDSDARHDRRKALWESGLISSEDLTSANLQTERAATDLEVARARVAEQVVRVQQSQESLDNTMIKAGFEGTVAATYLDAGATVHSGTPIISLMRSTDLWVRFAVPEGRQAGVKIGSAITFSIEGLDIVVPAVVEHVSPGIAAIAQDLVVEAKLKIPAAWSGQIKPGASGLASPVIHP